MTTSAEPQALTIGQAAIRLGVHRETLRAAIERGEIPAARLGRRWLVPVAALDRLLALPAATVPNREKQ
ncbi:MAG: helix-turn-helix domain-containing protein [Acidimicrobiales bacterium]|jgi:excisionase family DNA binding protein